MINRKSVVKGKNINLGGRELIDTQKKKHNHLQEQDQNNKQITKTTNMEQKITKNNNNRGT